MKNEEILAKAQPFGALIAPSTLIVAVLYLAGFSYRWSYYYNFGVQDLVFKLSFQSFLITAMEIIREPKNLLITASVLIGLLVLTNLLVAAIQWAARIDHPGVVRRSIARITKVIGLNSPLTTDAIRALVVIYAVYMLSSAIGYEHYQQHIVNSAENTLPVVTAIIEKSGTKNLVLGCGEEFSSLPNIVGDAAAIRTIQESHETCSLDTRVWRLLYRDDKSVYLFASDTPENARNGRPLTIVLPNTDQVSLVMR